MRRTAMGCASLFLVVAVAITGWGAIQYRQVQQGNDRAARVFQAMCQPQNLYMSGTLENWMDTYESIKDGTFTDAVHLLRFREDETGSPEFAVTEGGRVVATEVTVSLMDSDDTFTLRDPAFWREHFGPQHFGLPILGDGLTRENCIVTREPELHEWLWTE